MVERLWPSWEQKLELFRRVGYDPKPQQVPVHRSVARHLAIFGGERAGKSMVTAMECLSRLFFCPVVKDGVLVKQGRVAIVAVEYESAEAEADYLAEALEKLEFLTYDRSNDRGREIGVGGTEKKPWVVIKTISMKNGAGELTGKGKPYDIVLLVEAGLLPWNGYEAALGRVADCRGTIVLSGTLWDRVGWYAELWERWAGANIEEGERFLLRTADNTAAFPRGMEEPELKIIRGQMTPDEWARRYEAELLPSPALVYGEFSVRRHVKPVVFDEKLPVVLGIDAGYFPSAYAVLVVQFVNRFVVDGAWWDKELTEAESGRAVSLQVARVVDEIYMHKSVHSQVIAECKRRPWWGKVTRVIGGHEVATHQAQESTAEVWRRETGHAPEQAPKGVLPGVSRVRTWMVDPGTGLERLEVAPHCLGFIREVMRYSRRKDNRGMALSEEPEDANNDLMDCLRNLLVQVSGWVDVSSVRRTVIRPNPVAWMQDNPRYRGNGAVPWR